MPRVHPGSRNRPKFTRFIHSPPILSQSPSPCHKYLISLIYAKALGRTTIFASPEAGSLAVRLEGERRQGLSKTAPMACLPKPGREPWPPDAPWQTHRRYLARRSCLTNVFSASFVQLVSGAGDENERLAAERGKLGGAGSVRDPCGFGPDKACRHVSGSSWHAPSNWGILLRPARTRLSFARPISNPLPNRE